MSSRRLLGYEVISKFGRNESVGATSETVWTPGGLYAGFLTAATQIELVSDDVQDGAAGTGARTIIVEGLDGMGAEIKETITLDGTTPVTSASSDWFRVSRAYVETTGTYATSAVDGANAGTIIVRPQGGGVTLAQIDAQEGQTEMAIYTVPVGRQATLKRLTVQVSQSNGATVELWQRPGVLQTAAPYTGKRLVRAVDDLLGTYSLDFDDAWIFESLTDIWAEARRIGGADAEVAVDFDIALI